MRIGLINVHRTLADTPPVPPLGITYLAASLKHQDHTDVELLDICVATEGEINGFIGRFHDLVGLSSTSHSWHIARDLGMRLKAAHPDSVLVVGGPHVDAAMEDVLDCQAFDFAFYGEGERSFQTFVRALERGDEIGEGAELSNLIVRGRDGVRALPRASWIKDLDSLPFPDFSQLPFSRYKVYPIMSSRGCPFRCVFCSSSAKWGRSWRCRSAQNLIEELLHARQQGFLESRTLVFLDDTFNLNAKRVEEYCQSVIENGLRMDTMVMGVRANLINRRQAHLMKFAGISRIGIGIESASTAVLKKIGKGQTIDQIQKAISILHEAGIRVTGLFMIGNPGDTLETVRTSIRFAKEAKLDDLRFSTALPYPTTQLWSFVERNGRFLSRDYTSYDFLNRQPMFDTPTFPLGDRLTAWREAKRCELRQMIGQMVRDFQKVKNWRWLNLVRLGRFAMKWVFLK